MNRNIELTNKEKSLIKKEVTTNCANYERGCGCIPLNSECYMFNIAFRDSALCHYFERALLPTNVLLQQLFYQMQGEKKKCKNCGKAFVAEKNRQYCSDKCANEMKHKKDAERSRKYREKKKY